MYGDGLRSSSLATCSRHSAMGGPFSGAFTSGFTAMSSCWQGGVKKPKSAHSGAKAGKAYVLALSWSLLYMASPPSVLTWSSLNSCHRTCEI